MGKHVLESLALCVDTLLCRLCLTLMSMCSFLFYHSQWVTKDLGPDAKGRYVRRETQFRKFVKAKSVDSSEQVIEFPAEANRYLLIVSLACGWSHRTLLVRASKGLENVIPVLYVDPFMGENGWTIKDGIKADQLYEDIPTDKQDVCIKKLHELYVLAKSDYTGRVSVPTIWDRKTGTIVNNESSEIIKMFGKEFEEYATNKEVDLFPSDLQPQIDDMVKANYVINNGVYRCGFASSQEAYTEAVTEVFQRLEEVEEILGCQRYLLGNDNLTSADLCLFPTIFRFDYVYYTHFKCNKKHIYEYPNIFGWMLEVYQFGQIKDTCNISQICEHYYTSHESIHPRRYIPIGPDIDLDQLHGRDIREYGTGNSKRAKPSS